MFGVFLFIFFSSGFVGARYSVEYHQYKRKHFYNQKMEIFI